MEKIDKNKNVNLLIGHPKKAIINLALPMILANIVQTLYNLVDAIWVSGIGGSALASIGIFFPFNMAMVSISVGLSSGVSSSIARFIGAKKFDEANKSANQSILLTILLTLFLTLFLGITIKSIFKFMGLKEDVYKFSLQYSYPLILGSFSLFLTSTIYGILRGQGNAKGTMIGIISGAILNIILDPIFIYLLNLKVLGAALATLISQIFSLFVVIFILLSSKNNLIRINILNFNSIFEKIKNKYKNNINNIFDFLNIRSIKLFDRYILNDILNVAIPVAFAQLSMSIAMFFINYFILKVNKSIGVAIFTSAWRIILFAIVPLTGLAASSNVVVGANYGKRDFAGIKLSYFYSIYLGFILEIFVFVLINIFSKEISLLFLMNKENISFIPYVSDALKSLSIFIPFVSFGMNSSSFFQGLGDGKMALFITIIRTIIFQILFSYLFGIYFKFGLKGICYGISFANIIGSFIGFSIGLNRLKKLRKILI